MHKLFSAAKGLALRATGSPCKKPPQRARRGDAAKHDRRGYPAPSGRWGAVLYKTNPKIKAALDAIAQAVS